MSLASIMTRRPTGMRTCIAQRRYASESSAEANTARTEAEQTEQPPPVEREAPQDVTPAEETTGRYTEVSRSVWLKTQGERYRRPLGKGRTNFLSSVPFPLNPSFAPKPPLSNIQRNRIYGLVKAALNAPDARPEATVLREIAQRNNLSVDRLKAIVKLKVVEQSWEDSQKALQMNFSNGMEDALGVRPPSRPPIDDPPELSSSRRQIFEVLDLENVRICLILLDL